MDRREYKQMMEQIRPAPELMERVLAEGQTERSRPMKHRIRAAGVAALAAALLMGTALAVNSGFLERYFKGDLSVVEPYIQGGESVSDGKFRLTLDSAVVDQYGLVAQVTLEALTDEGAAWLMEGAQMSPWERYDAPESNLIPETYGWPAPTTRGNSCPGGTATPPPNWRVSTATAFGKTSACAPTGA